MTINHGNGFRGFGRTPPSQSNLRPPGNFRSKCNHDNWRGANVEGTKCRRSKCRRSNCTFGAIVGGANVAGANVGGAIVVLSEQLSAEQMSPEQMSRSKCRRSKCRGANVGGAIVVGANVGGAFVVGANVPSTPSLTWWRLIDFISPANLPWIVLEGRHLISLPCSVLDTIGVSHNQKKWSLK